ncbi:MAG: DsbE family thiol:disulfide interchange protein [Pseudomonadota bacterium]
MTAAVQRRRLVFALPLVVIFGLGAMFLFGLNRDPNYLPSNLIDRPVPNFDLPGLDGGRFTNGDLPTGEPTIVNFFASWCGPCRVEHPFLMDLADEAAVYGVAWRDDPVRSQAFLDELGDPFRRVGVDRDNRVGVEFGLYGVPETYVIDADGRILLRHAGPITPEIVDQDIRPLLR